MQRDIDNFSIDIFKNLKNLENFILKKDNENGLNEDHATKPANQQNI